MSKKYKVGYGKPPKETQFQPGVSGNPAGRPKNTKNLSTDLEAELNEKVLVTEGSKQVTISKQRAMVKSLMAKALKGDVRAADALIKLILSAESKRQVTEEATQVNDDDIAVLEAFKEHVLNTSKSTAKKES